LNTFGDKILVLAFSPDGRSFAYGTQDGQIVFWDVGDSFYREKIHTNQIGGSWFLAYSPDGKTLASGSAYGRVNLWDVRGRQSLSHSLFIESASDVVYSLDGKMVATGGCAAVDSSNACTQGLIRLWSTTDRKAVREPLTRHTASINAVAFSPDSKVLASAGADMMIGFWNLETGSYIAVLSCSTDALTGIAYSPDGKMLVTTGRDNRVCLYEATTGRELHRLNGSDRYRATMARFSPDSTLVALADTDSNIHLWPILDSKLDSVNNRVFQGHTDAVNSIAFSADGKTLVSGSADSTIRLWDVSSGKPIGQPLRDETLRYRNVNAVAFDPKGKIVAVAVASTVQFWDVSEGKALTSPLRNHPKSVVGLAFGPDGKTLVSVSADGTTLLWSLTESISDSSVIAEPFNSMPAWGNAVAFRRLYSR
jgi:WD40 repeat protein